MKKKLLTLFLSAMSVFLFSELRYLPRLSQSFQIQPMPHLNSKILIRPTRVSTLILSTKLPNVKIGTLTKPSLVSMPPLTRFNQDKLTPSWPVLLLPTNVRRSLLSQTLITTPQLLSTHVVAIKSATTNNCKGKTVGVKNGTASQTWLDKNASKYGFTVKTF